jgi:hypothetical protein
MYNPGITIADKPNCSLYVWSKQLLTINVVGQDAPKAVDKA